MVDDAILVDENIDRQQEKHGGMRGSIEAAYEIANLVTRRFPVWSSRLG